MLGYHGALVAIQRYTRLMERLFGVPQLVVELCYAAFKDGPEIAWNKGPPDGYKFLEKYD